MTHTWNMNIPIKQVKGNLNPKLQTHFKSIITESEPERAELLQNLC